MGVASMVRIWCEYGANMGGASVSGVSACCCTPAGLAQESVAAQPTTLCCSGTVTQSLSTWIVAVTLTRSQTPVTGSASPPQPLPHDESEGAGTLEQQSVATVSNNRGNRQREQ